MEGDDDNLFLPKSYIISIHTLRMEGDRSRFFHRQGSVEISIHTLRMEGDSYFSLQNVFLCRISIHTLRMEGDPGGFS